MLATAFGNPEVKTALKLANKFIIEQQYLDIAPVRSWQTEHEVIQALLHSVICATCTTWVVLHSFRDAGYSSMLEGALSYTEDCTTKLLP